MLSVVAGATAVESVVTAGAGVSSTAGATVAAESVAGVASEELPPQEAKNRPIDRATMLIFTSFINVVLKKFSFLLISTFKKGNPAFLYFYKKKKLK